MAAKSNSSELPKHWVIKKSRRWSSMVYYFNTKTGKSSWIHPSLIVKGSPSCSSELRERKLSQKKAENDKKILPKSEVVRDKPEEEINEADSQIHSESSPLREKSVISKSDDSHAETEKNCSKRKPVSFVIKASKKGKNVSDITKDLPIKKTPVPIHPNLLRARKIAEKVKWSKKKEVNTGPLSRKTVADTLLKGKTLLISEAKHKSKDKEIITRLNTRKTLEVKRTKVDQKNKDDEDIISRIIKEVSSSPDKDEKGIKLPVKDKKVVRHNKNKDYDDNIFKKFKKESSPKPHLSNSTPKEARVPPCDKTVPEQILFNQSDAEVKYDEVTEMEVEEHEIIFEIANFRGSVSHSKQTDSNQLLTSTVNSSSNSVYVVVDTNVLIQDIGFLEKLKREKISGKKVIIVIPYTALQEMDGLKKKESIGKACQTAICWCNGHFEKNDQRVQGQSYDNYLKTVAENQGSGGDDLIRDCCLLLKKEGLEVCLLTNDVNLRNKALMATISAVSVRLLKAMLEKESIASKDILEDCDSQMYNSGGSGFDINTRDDDDKSASEYPQLEKMVCDITPRHHKNSLSPRLQGDVRSLRRNVKFCDPGCSEDERLLREISNSLHHTLGQILEFIMKDAYEDIWLTIIKHKPPWSISEVFSCWEKHWIAVMNERFPRKLKVLLLEVKNVLEDCKRGRGDIATLHKKVEILYKFFESRPYHKFILPIDVQSSQAVISKVSDISSIPHSSDEVRESDTVERLANDNKDSTIEQITSTGIANIEKMINLVGLNITHFIALILDAFEVVHSLPTLNSSSKMTREDARGSGINLHKVTMRLGNAIVRCLTEITSDSLQELGNLLVSFWAEAKEPCPNLPFTEENLAQYVTSSNGQHFLKLTLGELENLLTTLMPVIESG